MRHLVRAILAALTLLGGGRASPAAEPAPTAPAADEPVPLTLQTIAEKRVTELPKGELFWRVENFASLEAARKAGGNWSMAAEAGGRVWLFTLAPKGGATPGGAKRADVGPIRTVTATNYLLKVNQASGARGAITPVHTHPGSEAFFVLAGEQSIRTPHGTMVVKAGQPEAGHGPGMPMQVSSSGKQELLSLVMFVVDADRPFAPPATL
jgi:mannose-6-phosphate isomerase-like protein (cupin superfamily)